MLTRVVRQEADGLRRYATRLLRGSGVDPDDVLQEVWLRAHRALPADGHPRAWLYTVTHHCAMNALRTAGQSTGADALEGMATPRSLVADVEQRERFREVMQQVARLPQPQRRALVAHVMEGRPHEQIARELQVTSAASRQLVLQARRTLAGHAVVHRRAEEVVVRESNRREGASCTGRR